MLRAVAASLYSLDMMPRECANDFNAHSIADPSSPRISMILACRAQNMELLLECIQRSASMMSLSFVVMFAILVCVAGMAAMGSTVGTFDLWCNTAHRLKCTVRRKVPEITCATCCHR